MTEPRITVGGAMSMSLDGFIAGVCGAVISGRRTYDVSKAWGGKGPLEGRAALCPDPSRSAPRAPRRYPLHVRDQRDREGRRAGAGGGRAQQERSSWSWEPRRSSSVFERD